MNDHDIEDCIQRVRMAKNSGIEYDDIRNSLKAFYPEDIISYAWYAGIILDNDIGDYYTDATET